MNNDNAGKIQIDGFSIDLAASEHKAQALMYSNYSGDRDEMKVDLDGGEDMGAVLVRLAIDGDHHKVTIDAGQSRDVSVLAGAIEQLQVALDRLAALTGEHRAYPGRCMASGDYGRCKLREDHEAEQRRDGHEPTHVFPTEEEFRAELAALRPLRRKVSA